MKHTDRSAAALAERTGGWETDDGLEARAMFRHVCRAGDERQADGGRGRRQEKCMAKAKGGSQANGSLLTALDVSLIDGLEGAETLAPACGWWWHGTLERAATKKKALNSSTAPTVKHAIAPCEQVGVVCGSCTYIAW